MQVTKKLLFKTRMQSLILVFFTGISISSINLPTTYAPTESSSMATFFSTSDSNTSYGFTTVYTTDEIVGNDNIIDSTSSIDATTVLTIADETNIRDTSPTVPETHDTMESTSEQTMQSTEQSITRGRGHEGISLPCSVIPVWHRIRFIEYELQDQHYIGMFWFII